MQRNLSFSKNSNNTFFFFNDTATTEIYTLSLHDALPICIIAPMSPFDPAPFVERRQRFASPIAARSEEHTSELQSRENLVCRLLLEKKKKSINIVFILCKHLLQFYSKQLFILFQLHPSCA